jgi:polyhydroxybutyrate depolymerase
MPLAFAFVMATFQTSEIDTYTIEHQGRTWEVHVAGSKSTSQKPLIVTLHGGGGSGRQMLVSNGWDKIANKGGCIIISPTGQPANDRRPANFLSNPNVWNSGVLKSSTPRTRLDDVKFLDALLLDASTRFNIDPKRIYMTGHSNGASMTWKYVAEGATKLAAAAPVMSTPYAKPTSADRAVPMLWIFGMKDPLVPWVGGERKTPWSTAAEKMDPILPQLSEASKLLGGKSTPITTKLPGPIQRLEFGPLHGGAPFTVLTIEGHGHHWPGGESLPGLNRTMGPSTDHLDATERIWEFFRNQPMRSN